ncbi:hypothetical protein PHSY_000290 [Pseudozyma hubeiensis SY62]|uniref:Uncharacterized protein n=1 Tax=Pseudozyma hubeiensis (strain SY62) TaxID=1305764 RepID=R9P3R5_PSEHS|nr:hypothetical protein PHSY_000290 [Pseudozyma hubeiensis SY62]GAC92735.1 hypothetical protein PHSY_000290 [Pseudozyma hubeiensis SY62]
MYAAFIPVGPTEVDAKDTVGSWKACSDESECIHWRDHTVELRRWKVTAVLDSVPASLLSNEPHAHTGIDKVPALSMKLLYSKPTFKRHRRKSCS